ncbi:hypothetical protein HPULCUR_001176 [Helicostylum pulchrum]|uniref:Uncharacterized protein n=1 Tax=Helicostylum pulchrum TaxID=562976 RepID=A0ABP9XM40_9FUNG
MAENTVLAEHFRNAQDEQNNGSNYSPRNSRLIEFSGAEGWWNAEKLRPITIKNSPFNPLSQNNVNAIKNSTDMTSTNVSPFGNAFSNSEFSVMDISKQLNSTLSKMGSDRNALKQLIASLQTKFVSALRTPREPRKLSEELTFVEDDDEDTTAIYTDFIINGYRIKTLIDGGAAKTRMSDFQK